MTIHPSGGYIPDRSELQLKILASPSLNPASSLCRINDGDEVEEHETSYQISKLFLPILCLTLSLPSLLCLRVSLTTRSFIFCVAMISPNKSTIENNRVQPINTCSFNILSSTFAMEATIEANSTNIIFNPPSTVAYRSHS